MADSYENEGPHGLRRRWRDLGNNEYAPSVYNENASGGGLTDAQLRASAVPVSQASQPLPTGAATEATLAGVKTGTDKIPASPAATADVQAVRDRLPAALDADGGVKTHVQNFPATQPVSGTVTANAGTGPFPVSDNAGSLTVDAPVGTPVFVRLSDGTAAIATLPVSLASLPTLAAGTNNIGDVDVLTLPAIPAGNNNIGDIDVLTINGQAPAFNSGVRGATVQRVTIATDDIVPVTGTLAHDAVDSGNPAKIGGKVIAAAGTPSFVSATGDRADAAFDSAGRLMIMEPVAWTVSSAPAANTQASASKAAGGTGVKHVLTSLFVQCHNSGAATAAVLIINVRDGASGAGTVLWTLRLPIAATTLTSNQIFLNDLSIIGSAATAMTVEFSAAGGANTNEIVNIAGYDTV